MSTTEQHSFQAEIQQVLEIVIHSLYTDREIFIRELVSNAADACERLRFLQAAGAEDVFQPDIPLTVSIKPDETAHTITITDTGVGMTHAELVHNLGTIAHSGTKAFLRRLADSQRPNAQIIGQFGVGFYSAFMVAHKVTVLSRAYLSDESGWKWTSEGAGGFNLEPAPDLPRGTQILIELKEDAHEFAQARRVEQVIQRYSKFVQFPLELNGQRLNTLPAIWARNKAEVKEEEYNEFYRYLGHDAEAPLYRLHFTADAPLSIQALLFVPARNLELLGLDRLEPEVHLYCRKVLIDPHAHGLWPEWLRCLRGVVDSEDLPLNISRERMQDSALLHKLNRALTNRFLKFLEEQAESDPAGFMRFYEQYGRLLKEGILSDREHSEKLAGLLRFESSALEEGKRTSLAEYVQRMPSDQTEIYYLLGGNRAAAQSSPYFEVFRARHQEVLFLADPVDEFVMDQLHEFSGKRLVSAEKAAVTLPENEPATAGLGTEDAQRLGEWMKETLGTAVAAVRPSQRLVESPALILDHDRQLTATMRQLLRASSRLPEAAPQPTQDLEINPRHPLIVHLAKLREGDGVLARKITEQLLDNARLAAGLLEDPRTMLQRLNELLEQMATPKS